MGDIYDLFFSGKELPTKKKQLIPNFFTKPVKTEENAPKNSDRDRSENLVRRKHPVEKFKHPVKLKF